MKKIMQIAACILLVLGLICTVLLILQKLQNKNQVPHYIRKEINMNC